MLDSDYINRAAPPGSMRYFALLYAPTEIRDALAALLVIDAEIRNSVNAAHEVAHTRLQWWRGEIDRLVNRNAQHPATQALQAARPDADFARLHEVLVAADMDLARMTYASAGELDAYLERCGELFELIAAPDQNARQAGALIRRVETLRDLAVDGRAGRVYWPLDELERHTLTLDELRQSPPTDNVRTLLAAEAQRLRPRLESLQVSVRPLRVLVDLHLRLLRRIERANFDVAPQRLELGSLEKIWTAWRSARRS